MRDLRAIQKAAWAKYTGNKAARLAPMMAAAALQDRRAQGRKAWATLRATMTPEEIRAEMQERGRLGLATRARWSDERRALASERQGASLRQTWAQASLRQRRRHGWTCTRGKYRGHDGALWAQLDEAASVVIELTHPRYRAGQADVWASLRAVQRGERTIDAYNPHAWLSVDYVRTRDALYKAHQRFRDKIGALLHAEPNRLALESALLVVGRIA